MKKSSKVFLIFGAVAAIAIAVIYLQYPPFSERDASGAIGAVEKYRDQQIGSQDVVLGDEQQRKAEAGLYANLLTDAVKLESLSAELASFAANLESASVESVGSFTEMVSNRAELNVIESLGIVTELQAREELSSFAAELASMQAALQNVESLNAMSLASFEQSLANIESALAARAELASVEQLESESALGRITQTLDNREASLASESMLAMTEQLASMTTELQAQANLEAKALESLSLASRVEQLGARFLEQRVLMAAAENLSSRSAAVENRMQFANFAADLASRAASLESRALANMESRLEMRQLEAKSLGNMEAMAARASESLGGRAQQVEAKSLASMTEALSNVEQTLASRQQELAQRYLVGAQAELAAIGAHLESMESLASRQQQLGSEQMLAMRNLGSFTEHLGNLTASLDSRSLVGNRQADALGSRATELQNRTADLQSRFANTE
jgi:hypothetical protein